MTPLADTDRQHLIAAIETIVDGFVLFDADDRLVTCNARYREIYARSAPALVPGARFEDILRYGLAQGQYAEAIGREEAWLAERLVAHRDTHSSIDQQLADGRWLRVIERSSPDGGRVGLRIDITEQKRQEQRLADIIAGTDVGTWEWNVRTGETRFNERWAEIVGYTLDELAPIRIETWLELCHPDDLARSAAALQRHFAGETPFYECEVRMCHKAGHWVWVLDRGRVANRTADGRPEWVSGTHLDITERKRTEVILESSRSRLDQLLETSPALIYAFDAVTWRPTYVSGKCRELYGLEPEAILSRPSWWIDSLHPDDRERVISGVHRWLEEGASGVHRHSYRASRGDGSHVWIEDQLRVLRDADGAICELVGSQIDITEQKQRETELATARKQLQATLEAIPDLLFEIDGDGRYLSCHSNQPERLLPPEERFLGRTIAEVLPPDVAAIGAEALDEAARTGRSSVSEFALDTGIGRRWFELSVARRADGDGAKTRFVVLARDVTERKRLEGSLAEERDFLDRIMATSISAVVVLDAEGSLVYVNAEAERVLGTDLASLGQRRYDDPDWHVTTLDGRPFPVEDLPFNRVMASGTPVQDVRLCIRWPDGKRRALSLNAAPLAATGSGSGRVVCSIVDITERLEAERALQHQEGLLRGLFELSPVGIALNDFASGRYLDANAALLDALGYRKDELLALSYFEVTPARYHALEVPQRQRLLAEGRYGPFEKEYVRKDGSRYPVLLNGILMRDLDGRPLIWSFIEDISERKAETAKMLEAAHYDPLTGLANRRLFRERLAQALERARRGQGQGAVAMLDLDHFKPVNDRLGHRAGDEILIEATARLTACTRKTDTVGRFGGDEFVVLLDAMGSPEDAAAIAGKIQGELSRPFEVAGEVAGQVVELGVSIGLSVFPTDSDDLDELLHMADIAMYTAKRTGRRRSQFYEPGLVGRSMDQGTTANDTA